MKELQKFIDEWKKDDEGIKPIFISFYEDLLAFDQATYEFHERPNVSYSLRGIHQNQKDRPLFVMIDVIDDDPEHRWLSVCFYGDMINDSESLGDLIPEGLLGEDGYCFDLTEAAPHHQNYIRQRIREAYKNADEG